LWVVGRTVDEAGIAIAVPAFDPVICTWTVARVTTVFASTC
jgi:hypothetical protein